MSEQKPCITIAMAVYRPNIQWLQEQLLTLEQQDYTGKMELLVWNDSPQEFACEAFLKKHLQSMSWKVMTNGHRNGVTRAFAALTQAAGGRYIAYCDQDDLWAPDKLSQMERVMVQHPECICCHGDVRLIGRNGEPLAPTIYPVPLEQLNDKHWQQKIFYLKNWTLGCAMLFSVEAARKALPFPQMVYHDQWLALYAAFHGGILFVPQMVLSHRLHGRNNSRMLAGIQTREEYYSKKLEKDSGLLAALLHRLDTGTVYVEEQRWICARQAWRQQISWETWKQMMSVRRIRPGIIVFELLLRWLPDCIFSLMIFFVRGLKSWLKSVQRFLVF